MFLPTHQSIRTVWGFAPHACHLYESSMTRRLDRMGEAQLFILPTLIPSISLRTGLKAVGTNNFNPSEILRPLRQAQGPQDKGGIYDPPSTRWNYLKVNMLATGIYIAVYLWIDNGA